MTTPTTIKAEYTRALAAEAALSARLAKLETPPPPTITGRVISPTGSDTAGTGSTANPWATLARFYAQAGPGDTLLCRGGSYVHPAGVDVVNVATAGAPITIRNYPGEVPVFNGAMQMLRFNTGAAHHVLDGLQFVGASQDASILWVGNGDSVSGGALTGPVTFRNLRVVKTAGARPTSHGIYLSWWAKDVLVEGSTFIGQYPNEAVSPSAAGVHLFHSPGPAGTIVRRCVFDGWEAGIMWWDAASDGEIAHNTFVNCYANIRADEHAALLVRDNAGTTAAYSPAFNLYDPNSAALTTADHNFWAQTFDGTYHLLPGQTGKGAASDSTDAGAL